MTGRKYFSKFNLKVHTVTDQLSVLATYFKTKSFSIGAFLHWVLNSVKVKAAKSVQRKFFRKNYLRKVSSKIDHKNRCYIYWIYSPISTGCWVTCSYHLNKDLECKQNGLKFSHEMFDLLPNVLRNILTPPKIYRCKSCHFWNVTPNLVTKLHSEKCNRFYWSLHWSYPWQTRLIDDAINWTVTFFRNRFWFITYVTWSKLWRNL